MTTANTVLNSTLSASLGSASTFASEPDLSFAPRLDFGQWIIAKRNRPASISSEARLLSWVDRHLRVFFPFKRFLGCYGTLTAGHVNVRRRVALGHSAEDIARIPLALDYATSGCIRRWAETRRPLLVDFADPPAFVTPAERALFRDAGCVAAHGVADLVAGAGTYFAFGGLDGPLDRAHAESLDMMAPTLHAMMVDLVHGEEKPRDPLAALTPRQREIARRAMTGATAGTMAAQLSLNEQTVRNTLTRIYAELGVTGRAGMIALLR